MLNINRRSIIYAVVGLGCAVFAVYAYLFTYTFLYTKAVIFDIELLIGVFVKTKKVNDVISPLLIISLVFMLPFMLVVGMKRKESLYGEASWATESDIKKQGLRHKTGIIFGKKNGKYLINQAQTAIVVCMPPGGGKNVGFVFPNLLNYDGSVVVNDQKFENFEITSGFRQKYGHEVYRFSPLERNSHCYNPFDDIDRSPEKVELELRKIASILIPKPIKDSTHWTDAAKNLFVAIAKYIIDNGHYLTIYEIYRFTNYGGDLRERFTEIVKSARNDHVILTEKVEFQFNEHIHRSDDEAGSVVSSMNTPLSIFTSQSVINATSRSDFSLHDLKKRKISLYLCFKPNQIEAMAPVISLFAQLAVDINTDHLTTDDEPHQLCLLMDELTRLKNIEAIKSGISYFRGYNVRFIGIIQNLSQLDSILGPSGRKEFLGSTDHQLYSFTNEMDSAKVISELLHNKTILKKNKTRSKGGISKNESDNSRALLLPQEVMGLDESEIILYCAKGKPVRAKKIYYYKEKVFSDRVLPPVEVPLSTEPKQFIDFKIVSKNSIGTNKAKPQVNSQEEPQEKSEEVDFDTDLINKAVRDLRAQKEKN